MKSSKYFESLGCIVKKETLGTFPFQTPLKALVLESLSPFPGYYSHEPSESVSKPTFLFLILKSLPGRNEDFIIRATQRIKQVHHFSFDASPGWVSLFNQEVPCVRLQMVNIDNLPVLIDLFEKQGLTLAKYQEVAPYEGIIRIKRYFTFEVLAEGIFRDTIHPGLSFVLLPDELSWEKFEAITLHVKRNLNVITFDAATGFYYDMTGVRDFVRIYAPSISLSDLQVIRDKYIHELTR